MNSSKMFSLFLALIFMVSVSVSNVSAKEWTLDKAHSTIGFSINHFFTPTKGKFDDFDLDINFDPNDLANSKFDLTIQVASVNTANEKRDGHLQTADFFDAEKYPTITFTSDKIVSKGDNNFVAMGKLKIKDVEKDIELPFKLLGVKQLPEDMQKMMGGLKEVAGFEANYSLNRNDYGVGTGSWAATVVVGDEVDIDIAVEAHIR